MRTNERVAEWLRGCPNTSEVSPVTVTIGKQTYHGAKYRQRDEEARLYLVGDLLASYRRSAHVVYRFADDSREWYIGCYWQGGVVPVDQERYHPLGHNFILFPWVHSKPIDYCERKPYRRMSATIGD